MKRDPRCWACCIWPVSERDAAETFAARLASNHAWTGGQHIYGQGALRLVGSVREPWLGHAFSKQVPA